MKNKISTSIKNFHFGILILIIAMLLMTILPLPTFLLDLFFTSNIAISLIILTVTIYIAKPLDFSIFPTILLTTTLLRLTLNIASTRVVLLNGDQGASAAGQVIRAFGEVVIGKNFIVGLIIFSILMIINFIVVTKGAGRVSEVSARFTLDAMPGKQMSIDADLNAGVINQEEAKKRRLEVIQEADFYGSMDGASKFIRGDAVAGLLILFINLIGGIIVGVVQHDMPLSVAFENFSILTIGDGLVAQIPSLLMSIAAAIMVTRVSSEHDMREEALTQLFGNTQPLLIVGAILLVIALIPKMPHIPFLIFAVLIFLIIYFIGKKEKISQDNNLSQEKIGFTEKNFSDKERELDWDDVISGDRVTLEISYSLIGLVGMNKDGLLINRIKSIRKKLSQELGFLLPTIHVRDNFNLPPNIYRIFLKGSFLAESEVFVEQDLAINPGNIETSLNTPLVKDPTFGLDAYWIPLAQREYAQSLGYTVADVSTVIATHLNHLIRCNADHLLGYDEVQQILNKLAEFAPKLIESLNSGTQGVPMTIVVLVLQRILQAGIPILDIRTIIEKLIELWSKTKDLDVVADGIRAALKRMIVYSICSNSKEVPVAVLDNDLAQILHKSIQQNADLAEKMVVLEPTLTERIYTKLLEYVRQCEVHSMPSIILVNSELRGLLEKLFKPGIPSMHFLAHREIPDDRQVNIIAKIG